MVEVKELRPIKEDPSDWDRVEEKLKTLFREKLYYPLLMEMGLKRERLKNENDALLDALRSGRVTFNRGVFSGRFSSSISKELKSLGARWDRKQGTWKIPQSSLPIEVRNAISVSTARFEAKLKSIDERIRQILPEEIAGSLSVEKSFDRALWKTDTDFRQSVSGITVPPQLTAERRAKIASEWQTNMRLWVKDFTEKEIVKLRTDIQKSAFSGDRYGDAVKAIQKSYGVSANKAKFLARQETSLLMTKFKEARYADSGVNEYKWGTVTGSKAHPVRPWHKALEGKIFTWDNPPITTKPGEAVRRNNPGQDYNCRCFAKPIVRFKKDVSKL